MRSRAVLRALALAGVLALPAGASAEEYLGREELLALAFPGGTRVALEPRMHAHAYAGDPPPVRPNARPPARPPAGGGVS